MIPRIPLFAAPLMLLLACSPDSTTPTDPVAGLEELPSQLAKGGRPALGGSVYVRSQGLYYKTFVTADPLPPYGKFQKLENGETDFGPGDPGYLGGRWWIDDGDGIQGPEDTYLLCPLLGKGHSSP
jgi:hypothetical protein